MWAHLVGPQLLTTTQAAAAHAVTTSTIRQWVRRGYLTPTGTDRRQMLFDARDVYRAAIAAGDRNRQPGGPLRRDQRDRAPAALHVSADTMNRIKPGPHAAALADILHATLRSWGHRGHLPATGRCGHTPLYLIADVVRAARRNPDTPRRTVRRDI